MEKDVAAPYATLSSAPPGLALFPRPPTAYAVGCILSPLCGCTKNLPTRSQILLVAERDPVCDRYHTNQLKSAPIAYLLR
jgi:hypothetical protein